MDPVQIQCPHCGFSRQVPADRIPADKPVATCPQCRQSFRLQPPKSEFGFTVAEGPSATVPAEAPRYAGFWIRFVAALIDGLLVSAAQTAFAAALALSVGQLAPESADRMTKAVQVGGSLGGLALSCLYYVGLTGYCGQTFGKMALRLKVIRTDGTPVGYGHAALREVLGKLVSTLLLFTGYLMAGVDRRKQALHDKMADTFVVRL